MMTYIFTDGQISYDDIINNAISKNMAILCSKPEDASAINEKYRSYVERTSEQIAISIDELIHKKFFKKRDAPKPFFTKGFIVYDTDKVLVRAVNHAVGKFVNIYECYQNNDESNVVNDIDLSLSCDTCIHQRCYHNEACGYCNTCSKFSNHSYNNCDKL